MKTGERKQKGKGLLVGFIVCIFFGVFSLCSAVFINPIIVIVDDTEEYCGTFESIEKKEKDFLISLDEYSVKYGMIERYEYLSNPSSILSKMMPSGLSGICSVAESTLTPLSLSVFLWMAVSYLLRENLSNLYTVTYFYGHFDKY